MAYGLQTFDGNGADNNTGIVRILALGTFSVGQEQSNSATFTVPAGYRMDYLFQSHQATGGTASRRLITISGGTISLSAVGNGDFSAGTQNAMAGYFLLYARI